MRHGFDQGWAIGSYDRDGDGTDEILYGGRGVAMVDERTFVTGQPGWSFKWDDEPDDVLSGGDNMWTTGVEMVEATGDEVPDALLSTSDSSAYLLDGVSGEKVWRSPTDGGLSNGFALIDVDSDDVPDMFPSGSSTALSGRTGEKLWEAPIPKNARAVASGDFDGDGKRDLIVTINPPGAGTNPNTIVPAITAKTVFVISSQGELLYDFAPYNGIEAMAGADIDGDGSDEAVLGTYNGILYVLDESGVRWSAALGPAAITDLQVVDVDGDGREEIFAGTGLGALGMNLPFFEVVGFGPEGGQRWRHIVPDPIQTMKLAHLDEDPIPELLVGGGTSDQNPYGSATALEIGLVEPARQKWQIETAEKVQSVVLLNGDHKRVAIASFDGVLRIVDADDGSELASWTAGGYARSIVADDLDGDGRDETVKGDHKGNVIVTDADGSELWSDRVPGSNRVSVVGLATGDLNGDGELEIAAAAEVFDRDDAGQLTVYSARGEILWTQPLLGLGQEVAFLDVDDDGKLDLVAGEGGAGLGDPCAIGGYRGANGERLWWKELPTCLVIHVDAADVDGDGSTEVGFGTQVLFGAPQVALLEADGTVVWHLEPPQASTWVDLEPGSFVHGGFADQSRGHLTDRDLGTGDIRWQSFIAGDRGNGGGANRFGGIVPDANGDGTRDIVTSSDSREILLVDGASGETIWATRIEAAEVPVTHAHQSGPVVYVAPDGSEPLIFASQYSTGRSRAKTFVLSLTGQILDTFEMEGEAHAASPATFAPDVVGVVVGAGLAAYAYQVDPIDPVDPVDPVGTTLALTVEGTGVNRALRVQLTAEDGAGVLGRSVDLSADGTWIGTIVTDETGAGSLFVPPRYRGGRYLFEAVFAGDDAYLGSAAQTST